MGVTKLRSKIRANGVSLADIQRASGLTYNRIQQGLTGIRPLSTREMAIIETVVDVLVKSRKEALCNAARLIGGRINSVGSKRRRTRSTSCAATTAAGVAAENIGGN